MKITRPKKEKVTEDLTDVINETMEATEPTEVVEETVEEVIAEEKITEEDMEKIETTVTKNTPAKETLEDRINNWKVKYPEIYETKICDQVFVWKPLTRSEYKEGYKAEIDRDLFTIKTACLYPSAEAIEDIVERKGGIGYILVELILAESGFNVQSSKKL